MVWDRMAYRCATLDRRLHSRPISYCCSLCRSQLRSFLGCSGDAEPLIRPTRKRRKRVPTRADTVLAAMPGMFHQAALRILWSFFLLRSVLHCAAHPASSVRCGATACPHVHAACSATSLVSQIYLMLQRSTGVAAFWRSKAPVYLLQKRGAATRWPEARTLMMHIAAAAATATQLRQWSQVRLAGDQACGHRATCQ
jgi:hypothetical protein